MDTLKKGDSFVRLFDLIQHCHLSVEACKGGTAVAHLVLTIKIEKKFYQNFDDVQRTLIMLSFVLNIC